TISYVIGHQRISQTIEINGTKTTHYFTFDGHGSTRVLLDAAMTIAQIFAFDAYGNAIGFDSTTALTEFLYSGEQFDSKIGQQYLRARYYDPTTGRFNRLDPFFGNLSDPQSLHKFLYCHAAPVSISDPTGLFGLAGVSVGSAMAGGIASFKNSMDFLLFDVTAQMVVGVQEGLNANQVFTRFLLSELMGFGFGVLFQKVFFVPEMIDFMSKAKNKIKYTFFSKSSHAVNLISNSGQINNIVNAVHAGVTTTDLGEAVIKDLKYAKAYAVEYLEMWKRMGKTKPGKDCPRSFSYMTGHFEIETWGTSTRGLDNLPGNITGFDA
ncbi:MAG: RHS repeat-associated core domain-containing protein, partial [Planctomycetaceae bacterium]|nr:RHS repeat-associated core domain-containing protein [Planctomycetaceae bacterium]